MSSSTILQLDTPLVDTSILPDARWMEEITMSPSSRDERVDLAASIVSSVFLFLLIFGLSATVDIRHLKQELRNKFALLTGVVMQFVIMPLLGFLSVLALRNQGLTQAMGITLLVVTASPGGSYSNWYVTTVLYERLVCFLTYLPSPHALFLLYSGGVLRLMPTWR